MNAFILKKIFYEALLKRLCGVAIDPYCFEGRFVLENAARRLQVEQEVWEDLQALEMVPVQMLEQVQVEVHSEMVLPPEQVDHLNQAMALEQDLVLMQVQGQAQELETVLGQVLKEKEKERRRRREEERERERQERERERERRRQEKEEERLRRKRKRDEDDDADDEGDGAAA